MHSPALPSFLSKKPNKRNIRNLEISAPFPVPAGGGNKYWAPSSATLTTEIDQNISSDDASALQNKPRLSEERRNKRLPRTPVDRSSRKPLPVWDAGRPEEPLPLEKVLSRESQSTVHQNLYHSIRQRRASISSTSSGSLYPTDSQEHLAACASSDAAYSATQAFCSYLHIGENIEPVEHLAVLRWSKSQAREALFAELYTNSGRILVPVVYPPEYESPLEADQAHAAHPEDVYQVIRNTGTGGLVFEPPRNSQFPKEILALYEREASSACDNSLATTLPPPSHVLGIVPGSLRQPPKIWKTISVVGSSSFGKVIRVSHVPSKTEVAMRVVHVQKPLVKITCESLVNELKVLTMLVVQSGKELVPFLAAPSLEYDKFAWLSVGTRCLHILTPFCPGGDLYDYDHFGREMDSLRLVVAELVLGLSYLHSLGIVHHDFKPENVLIDAEGHCMITDFGASRFLNEERKLTRITDEDFICSAPYTAPELISNGEKVEVMVYDEKVDWFSLGAVMYTLLTGLELFSRKGDVQVLMEQRRWIEDYFCKKFPQEVEDHFPRRFSKEVEDHFRMTFSKLVEDPELYHFMLQLLRFHPEDRLAGEDINNHKYLSPFENHWNEIINRQYTPPVHKIRNVDAKTRGSSEPPGKRWMVATSDKLGLNFSEMLASEGWYLPESEEYDFFAELKTLSHS
ncbi:hypothetical protein QCA50_019008 [Cerrena zonata]|uniref:Protein kinase domain-containing protein n=1 Tax=Cerrena zonata TaxID=2478898 RepID=A0AAW0FDB4_9APHY